MKKIILNTLLLISLLGTGSGIKVFADAVNVGGGVWRYGYTGTLNSTAYSNFENSVRTHASSVTNMSGIINSSGWTQKGVTSKASVGVGAFGKASFYYNYK
ncbi:MAG: lactococcin 972 family bacteriocin [Lactobacillaceae bacterium]|jgi:lactococcin 972 family bacteriocin|nr:lactococcin 972 family bacteriocin [Lactobacillaceae bacterium]